LGDIVIELNAEEAPQTTINFVEHAKAGDYDGTVFHRVTQQVVQGGGYTPDMDEKSMRNRDPISASESKLGLTNDRGTIAMYRDPFRVDSVRTQFFINLKDNTSFDRLRDGFGYPVFGKVVEGMDVVEKIAALPGSTHPKYAAGRNPVVPKELPVIKSVEIVGEIDRAKAMERAADLEQRRNDPIALRIRELEAQANTKAVRTASGLVYIDIKEGTGAFPLDEDTVEIDYEGYLCGVPRAQPFDSAMSRWGRPGKVVLGGLIKGLREGLSTMKERGKRILIVPPDLGFPEGIPAKVPAGATLEFRVELLGVSRDEPDR
jgi:peptidyl-prolyl cis-trans isomerase A (cyclophilin A)